MLTGDGDEFGFEDYLGAEEQDAGPELKVGVDEQELKSILRSAVRDAVNYAEEDLAEKRVAAADAYDAKGLDGDADLDETRSKVMSRDVHDTVHAILPSIMKIFCGTVDSVEYQPVGPEDEAFARQATQYVNKVVLQQDNDFYQVMYDASWDALVKGLGVFKWWWEEDNEVEGHYFSGLTPMEFNVLAAGEGIEITEYYEDSYFVEGQEMVEISGSLTRTVSRGGKLRIEAVPPEERLIERGARCIEDASFYGHRRDMVVSDLVAMGFDYEQVIGLAGGAGELDTNEEAIDRLDSASRLDNGPTSDPAMKEVPVTECYLRVDMDADGVAERYRIFAAGEACEILQWEDGDLAIDLCDDIPFAEITPDPVPHRATGRSYSAKVMDVQETKSKLLRGTLDSLSRSIFPREEVVEDQVNLDDAMNPEIGAIIRTQAPGMIREIVTPFMGKEAMPVLQYYDEIKANRSGVSPATMGLDPKTLQSSTAGAVEHAMSAAQSQIELVARHFGRGIREVFRGVLRTIVKNQDRTRTVRLLGQWIEVDPSSWNAEMDAVPVTAVGHGTEGMKMAQLAMIAGKQMELLQADPNNGVVSMEQYRATLAEMIQLTGFYHPEKFLMPVQEGQQVRELGQKVQQMGAELQKLEGTSAAMQQELMKRSQAAATKDQAMAYKYAADTFKEIVEGVQTAYQTEVEVGAAADEIAAYRAARQALGI